MTPHPPAFNLVLVGMPGSGKSTIGVILVKRLGLDFVDTDVLIQVSEGCTLQEILDTEGYLALRAVEERVLIALRVAGHVVATGGSAVYSDAAMKHLKASGKVVFLDVPLEEVVRRVRDADSRGIAAAPGTTLAQLFEQRRPLYLKYADTVVDCRGLDMEAVIAEVRRHA
jgi:shikimate kinase